MTYKPVGFGAQSTGGFGAQILHQTGSAAMATIIHKVNMTDEFKYVL